MARHLIVLTLLVAASATGFRLKDVVRGQLPEPEPSQYDPPQPRGPKPIYEAIIHFDGRPTEVLVDNLGTLEDLKFQTGDPVSKPYPFIGALGTNELLDGGRSFRYGIHCTASQIDDQTIMTAAHCYIPPKSGRDDIYVWGLSDIRVDGNNYRQKSLNFAKIEKLTQHPNYNETTVTNDICVGTLKEPLTNSQVKPICLGGTDRYNSTMLGAGWGMKDCQSASQETLRKAKSTLVNQQTCKNNYWRQLLDQQVCTFFKTDSGQAAAAAPGDSGGPLFSLANSSKPVQVGIASFVNMESPNSKCVNKSVPQVYVRVSSFRDFIGQIAKNPQWC